MPKIYITPEGAKKLQEEIVDLWKVQRPQVTQAVSEAAAMGDRSENADYIYGKKKLREIDERIRQLKKKLENVEIVSAKPQDTNKVLFGAYVRLQNRKGDTTDFRIVGPDDFDLERDGPKYMEHPRAKEWDELMRTFQTNVPEAPEGTTWVEMEEIHAIDHLAAKSPGQ